MSPLDDVSVGEILEKALDIESARWTRADQMRVTAFLKAKGGSDIRPESDQGETPPRVALS